MFHINYISILSHTRIPSNGNFRGIEGIEYVARGGYVQQGCAAEGNSGAMRKPRGKKIALSAVLMYNI